MDQVRSIPLESPRPYLALSFRSDAPSLSCLAADLSPTNGFHLLEFSVLCSVECMISYCLEMAHFWLSFLDPQRILQGYKCPILPRLESSPLLIPSQFLSSMAQNFSLSPEDRLLWQERAPRASYWFRVSDTHPFIHAGQPAAARSDTPPPPPYMPTVPPPPAPTGPPPIPVPTYQPPAPAPTHRPPAPMPASQPPMPAPAYHPTMPMPPYQPTVPMPPMPMPHYLPPMHLPTHPPFGNGQFIPGIPQLPHPIVMNPLPAINPVPIYDVRNQNNTALAPENPSRSSLPSRE